MVNDVNIWAVNDGEKIYKTDLKITIKIIIVYGMEIK